MESDRSLFQPEVIKLQVKNEVVWECVIVGHRKWDPKKERE